MIERLCKGVQASTLLEDVEVVEQRHTVAVDAENSLSCGIGVWGNGNLVKLGEMEHKRITAARVHGNRVGEMAVTLLCVEVWIGSAANLSGRIGDCAILKVVIGMPFVSIVVFDSSALHDEANRKLSMRQSGQDFKGVQGRRRAFLEELEMKDAILIRINILEDALIGDIGSQSVGADVERSEQHLAVSADVEVTGFWIILGRGHKKQMQLIRPLRKGDVVFKVVRSPVLEEHWVAGF